MDRSLKTQPWASAFLFFDADSVLSLNVAQVAASYSDNGSAVRTVSAKASLDRILSIDMKPDVAAFQPPLVKPVDTSHESENSTLAHCVMAMPSS